MKVLNGEVPVGDRVAYATREGNIAAIHLEAESGYGSSPGTVRSVSNLDRVVKL